MAKVGESYPGQGGERTPEKFELDSTGITKAIEKALSRSGAYERTLQEFYSPTFAIVGALEKTLASTKTTLFDNKKIVDELNAIAKTMGKDTFEELEAAVKGDTKQEKELSDLKKATVSKQNEKNQKALGLVFAIPVLKFTNFASKTIAAAFQMQSQFLQLNKTLPQIFDKFGSRLNSLPGDMQTNLATLFAFQKEGLTKAGKSTLRLANKMELTGQNIGLLIGVQKTLLLQGRMSAVARNSFSNNLDRLSVNYGVSTEKLLEGFGELNQSLSVLSLGGTFGAVGGSVTELGAKFPVLAQTIGSFTDKLLTADIGQLGILGGMEGVGRLTSSLSTDAGDLRDIIAQIAKGARKFTTGFRDAGIVSQRALTNVIGDIGVMAIQLDDAFGVAAQKLGAIDQITNDFKIAFNTAIEPFQQGLADSVIALATFAAKLSTVLPGSGDKTGEFIGVGITAAIIGKFVFGPLKFLLTPLLGLLPGIVGLAAPVIAPILAVVAILGATFWLFKAIKGSNDQAADSLAQTANNTRTLVAIEKKKNLETFGSSRFERLATRALEGNILRVAMSEAVATRAIVDGFASNAELLKELVDAGLIPAPLPAPR